MLDLALSARGHILASSSVDGTVRVWDTRTGLLLRKVATQGTTLALSLSASGEMLAFQKTDLASGPTIATVDLARGGEPRSLGETGSFMLSPDGKTIAVAFNGLRLYDAVTGAKLHDFDPLPSPRTKPPPFTRPVFDFDPHTLRAVAFDPTGRRLAVASAIEIVILEVATRKVLRRSLFSPFTSAETAPASMIFTDDVLVIMDASRRVHLLGSAEGSLLLTLPGSHASAAVAGDRLLTPDFSNRIVAWDLATGSRVEVPGLAALRATRLGTSADGSTLALAAITARDLRVVDARTWKPLRSIVSHTLPVHAVAVRPDGAAMLTSMEGGALGRWNLQTGELEELARGGPHLGWARLVYDDSSTLVAHVVGAQVRVLDARSGLLLRRWSAGKAIVTAWFMASARELVTLDEGGGIMSWKLAPSVPPAPRSAAAAAAEIARPPGRSLGAAPIDVTSAAVSADRTRLVVTGANRMSTVPDPSAPGKWKWAYTEAKLAMVSLPDGATIWNTGVTTGYPNKWLGFAPDGKSVLLSSNQDPREIPPRMTSIGELRDQQILRVFDGGTGALVRSAKTNSMGPLAVRDDVIAIGGRESALLSWPDLAVRERVLVPDYLVQAVAPHPGRKLFVFGGDSGATSLVSATTGKVTSILAAAEGGEYITTIREGAFRASLDGARGVAWTFGAPLEAFSFEQFSAQFDRPEVVARKLLGDESPSDIAVARPPTVRVEAPPGSSSTRTTRIRVQVASPRWVERVRVFADGRAAVDQLVCAPEKDLTIEVPLAAGRNRLTVMAYDADGFASNPATVDVAHDSSGAARPDLWVLAIGVSRYGALGPEHQLDFADDDARSITDALTKQAGRGRRFAELHATTLLDAQVTRESVKRSLEALAAMSPDDLAVVFLAGHGVELDKGKMVYLTSGASLSKEGARAHGVGWDVIRAALGRARGRVLLLLDACHSGHVSTEIIAPNEALAKELAAEGRSGVLVFAAARGAQLSYEVPTGTEGLTGARGLSLAWEGKSAAMPGAPAAGHGLFTSAVLEALSGEAPDQDRSGAIEVGELIDYVTERVRSASNGKQTPWVARREMFGDFVIAPAR